MTCINIACACAPISEERAISERMEAVSKRKLMSMLVFLFLVRKEWISATNWQIMLHIQIYVTVPCYHAEKKAAQIKMS